jgi:hypothetical protein
MVGEIFKTEKYRKFITKGNILQGSVLGEPFDYIISTYYLMSFSKKNN